MLRFALRNLLSRALRTSLSLLGLTVAIAGMVGLFSVARGLDQMVSQTFGRIPGLAAMRPGSPIPLFSTLPASWGEEIAAVEGVRTVMPELWRRADVINQKMILSPPRMLYGFDLRARLKLQSDVYRDGLQHEQAAGRFFTLEDRGTNHVLISRHIADEFKVGVGDPLVVNGHELEVIGIYQCDSLLLDVTILMDGDLLRRIERIAPTVVSSYYIEPEADADKDALVQRIRDVFRGRELPPWTPASMMLSVGDDPVDQFFGALATLVKSWRDDPPIQVPPAPSAGHPVKPGETPLAPEINPEFRVQPDMPIEVRTAQDWAKRFDRFADDLDVFLGVLTAIGMFIAVLSIINTMVMSVSERIIEFGILKANGWSKRDVLKLITCESGLIGVGGGTLGCLVGWVGVQIVNWKWPTRVDLYASPGLLAFSIVFAVALGVFGGLYPAVWAMRMMPMDAIRRG